MSKKKKNKPSRKLSPDKRKQSVKLGGNVFLKPYFSNFKLWGTIEYINREHRFCTVGFQFPNGTIRESFKLF